MIPRQALHEIKRLMDEFPAVGILGPRQIGKTTLAEEIASSVTPNHIYLDLESPSDTVKLQDPEAYFELHKGRLIVLDEIQRVPELFQVLRGIIDKRRREGLKTGQFLILGSASLELLQQSSETLAGRIAYKELSGITAAEINNSQRLSQNDLWIRGGFPDSLLAKNNDTSFRWRQNFITTYLERDIPQMGPRIPAVTLRRLWTMLAHTQGSPLNASQLGSSLDVTSPTVTRYVELLEDLLLIRSLRPWHNNHGKRLVKTPKIYIRDSGLVHALLNLSSQEDVLSHPVAGLSWEGFVVENILSSLPSGASSWFYRTSAGAEIDLVVEFNQNKRYAIEIKRSLAPVLSKGFYLGCEDIKATERFLVYPGKEMYPSKNNTIVMPLSDMILKLTTA